MRIDFGAGALAQDVDAGLGFPMGGGLALVAVDGRPCGVVDLSRGEAASVEIPSDGWLTSLPGLRDIGPGWVPDPGTAAECSKNGAPVTFSLFGGLVLAPALPYRAGTVAHLDHLEPLSGSLVAGAPMRFAVNATWSSSVAQRLIAFVDGAPCWESEPWSGGAVRGAVGLPGQPSACGRAGGLVTFMQMQGDPPYGMELVGRFRVVPGATTYVLNTAPLPPGSEVPSYMQAFLDGGGTVVPAAAGQAGLFSDRTRGSGLGAWALLAFVVALTAGVRRVARRR